MRRKDYEVVAKALAALPLDPSDHASVVATLSAAFAEENPRFDPEKFRAAAMADPELAACIAPETLTRIIIDYLTVAADRGLPTLDSITDVARQSFSAPKGASS